MIDWSWPPALVNPKSGSNGPWLVGPRPIQIEYPIRLVYPLEEPDLHRRFASIQSRMADSAPFSPDILDFANHYGPLGVGSSLIDPDPTELTPNMGGVTVGLGEGIRSQSLQWGESIVYWADQVRTMAGLIGIWDLAADHRESDLETYIAWPDDVNAVLITVAVSYSGQLVPEAVLRSQPHGDMRPHDAMRKFDVASLSYHTIAHEGFGRDSVALLEHFGRMSLCEPAIHWVYKQVNKVLHETTSLSTNPFDKGSLSVVPNSLLGALYMLFAFEMHRSWRRNPCTS